MCKPVLVIDLDETLLHTTSEHKTYARPYLKEFFDQVSLDFDLFIFTFGVHDYAMRVCSQLGIFQWVPQERIFSREFGVIDPVSGRKKKRFESILCTECLQHCVALDDSPGEFFFLVCLMSNEKKLTLGLLALTDVWDAEMFTNERPLHTHQVLRIRRFMHSQEDENDACLLRVARFLRQNRDFFLRPE